MFQPSLEDQQSISDSEQAEHEAAGSEYLAFTLGKEEYGIDILKVQEIRDYEAVTRVPHMPSFVKGVMNLRGMIVPVVDMRIRFNLGEATYDQFTIVIILNINTRVIGMVVDSVSDVTTIRPEQIKCSPDVETAFRPECLIGIGTIEKRMLILLDIEKLMTNSDMDLVGFQ